MASHMNTTIFFHYIRWGRRILEHSNSNGGQLSEEDRARIKEIVSPAISHDTASVEERIEEICSLIGGWRPGQDATEEDEEDLRLEEVQGTQQV